MELLYIIFLISVILFCGYNLVFLFTIRKEKLDLEEPIIGKPYQPPTDTEKVHQIKEELPIHRFEDGWTYDPNVNYRPRKVYKDTKPLTRLD